MRHKVVLVLFLIFSGATVWASPTDDLHDFWKGTESLPSGNHNLYLYCKTFAKKHNVNFVPSAIHDLVTTGSDEGKALIYLWVFISFDKEACIFQLNNIVKRGNPIESQWASRYLADIRNPDIQEAAGIEKE